MSNKLKDFLFPNKEKNIDDSETIMMNKDEIISNKVSTTTTTNIFNPKMFAQVEDVANELLSGKSVIVDLNSTDITEAKRICDFLNGVTFALDGKVEKVAKLVYLFSAKK